MSDVPSLQVLADNHEALLLAEVVALLHDVGKLSTQFIDQMSTNPTSRSHGFEHETAVESDFVDAEFVKVLKSQQLRNLLHFPQIAKNEQIGQALDLILYHDKARHSAFLIRLLNRCDGSDSGADKGTTRQDGLPREAKQEYGHTIIATAFGEESKLEEANLDTARLDLSKYVGSALLLLLSSRADLLGQIRNRFSRGLAETRRSANDVTLWDHSFSVGTLYKTSLATFLLKGALDLAQVHWRLLRVNFDVLGLYAKAVKIADLMGYQKAVENACAAVKRLVEEKYPLGNEIYRDTTGIYFTFPDLDLPADLEQEIRRRVEAKEPELAPRIAVEQPQGNTPTEQLKRMLAEGRRRALQDLAQPFDARNLSLRWQQEWKTDGKGNWELCPVCRLRPMKEGQDACQTCLQRRQSRVQEWQADPQQTIWIDEVADTNGRLALIVGKFGLDDWLSGDLVQTMLVKAEPNNPGGCVPKNPSPARLRRVWETCQHFWTETVTGILQSHSYGGGSALRCLRLAVVPDKPSGWQENVPYNGAINGKTVSLLWQADQQRFITISNLQLGVSQARDEAGLVGEWHGQTCTVDLPDSPGRQRTFKVQQVTLLSGDPMETYTPSLTLLESPDQFLALVPAAEALDIARKIEEQYRQQMGKVQNRLPLFLGLIFFPRKLPLMAVMDAARRMLEGVSLTTERWEIAEDVHNGKVKFTNGLEWNVSTVMGDGTTADVWYPYWRMDGKPDNCIHWFTVPDDEQDDEHWVYVNELKKGDVVFLTPSRFAYLFLESTAGRFRFDPQREALLLDERQRLQDLWQALYTSPDMSDSKLQAISALFERKRQQWGLPFPTPQTPIADEAFRHLIRTTLKRDDVKVRAEDVLNGRFQRTVELHLHILKRRVKEFRQKEAQDDQPNT